MDSDVVGSIGVLTVATRGPDGPGEVLIKVRGGSETYLAWADDVLPKGASVLVVESRGARTLLVVGWSTSTSTSPSAFGPAPRIQASDTPNSITVSPTQDTDPERI